MPRRCPLLLLHCLVTVDVKASAAMEGEGQTTAAPVEMWAVEVQVQNLRSSLALTATINLFLPLRHCLITFPPLLLI